MDRLAYSSEGSIKSNKAGVPGWLKQQLCHRIKTRHDPAEHIHIIILFATERKRDKR